MSKLFLGLVVGLLLAGSATAAQSRNFRMLTDSTCAGGGAAASTSFVEQQSAMGQMFDVGASASASFHEDVGVVQSWQSANAVGDWALYE